MANSASEHYSPLDPDAVLLSRFQATPLLEARDRGLDRLDLSLDLNRTLNHARLSEQGVLFPHDRSASWESIEKIAGSANGCFLLLPDGFWKIHVFSDLTNRPYSLMPTAGAPTVLNAGFTMHRIKGVTPEEDTRRKLAALGPVRGRILDTSTGLGYTAVEAARGGASLVVTIELDPAMLRLASYNPWSRELFEHSRIDQLIGDALEILSDLEAGSFDAVIHDPPTASLAGELYSRDCYGRLQRVLKPSGMLFHYVGNLESRQGSRTARQVVRGLREAGFVRVRPRVDAFGVTAGKICE